MISAPPEAAATCLAMRACPRYTTATTADFLAQATYALTPATPALYARARSTPPPPRPGSWRRRRVCSHRCSWWRAAPALAGLHGRRLRWALSAPPQFCLTAACLRAARPRPQRRP
eukprot:354166-Chlamydomonas_euryale.AAC.2